MERNDNEAGVCPSPIDAQTGASGEIDLYGELTAFAELSPDEQRRLLDRPKPSSAEHPLPAQETSDLVPTIENVPSELVLSGVLVPASDVLSPSEIVPAGELVPGTELVPADARLTQTAPQSVTAEAVDSVEAEAVEPCSQPASGPEESTATVEPPEARADVFVRPSGPLGSLTKGFVFTGALSRGVCIGCGAESGTDDLFCIACGVFIDEISTTRPVRLTCVECQQSISTDEIFCPWCGASLPE